MATKDINLSPETRKNIYKLELLGGNIEIEFKEYAGEAHEAHYSH